MDDSTKTLFLPKSDHITMIVLILLGTCWAAYITLTALLHEYAPQYLKPGWEPSPGPPSLGAIAIMLWIGPIFLLVLELYARKVSFELSPLGITKCSKGGKKRVFREWSKITSVRNRKIEFQDGTHIGLNYNGLKMYGRQLETVISYILEYCDDVDIT